MAAATISTGAAAAAGAALRGLLQTRLGGGGSFVAGVGVDVVQISRVRAVLARHGQRFLARAFHPREADAYALLAAGRGPTAVLAAAAAAPPPSHAAAYLAARWAAKEALHKALGGSPRLLFPELEVVRGAGGAPAFELHGAAAAALAARCPPGAPPLLSLSHDGDYAVAMVVLTREGGGGGGV